MKAQKAFIENLVSLRKSKGWTQEDMACKVGMSVRGYQKYEQGESAPTPDAVERFADVLGCEPYNLLIPPASSKSEGHQFKSPAAFAKFLLAFSDLPSDLQLLVLAVVHQDASFLMRASKSFRQKALAFVRRLEK